MGRLYNIKHCVGYARKGPRKGEAVHINRIGGALGAMEKSSSGVNLKPRNRDPEPVGVKDHALSIIFHFQPTRGTHGRFV